MMMTDDEYEALDPGIRDAVKHLHAHGFETTDSGDGVSKPKDWYESGETMPFKHVVITTFPSQMVEDAHVVLVVLGPLWMVECVYNAVTGNAHVFARERFADER